MAIVSIGEKEVLFVVLEGSCLRGMFAGHHVLFSRAIVIVDVQFFWIQSMLIVLSRRYVSVILVAFAVFSFVAFWDVRLFTNDGIKYGLWIGYICVIC